MILKKIYIKHEWKITINQIIDWLWEKWKDIKKNKKMEVIIYKMILALKKASDDKYPILKKILNSEENLSKIIFDNAKLVIDIRALDWFQSWQISEEENIILKSVLFALKEYLWISQAATNSIIENWNIKKKIYTFVLNQMIESFVRMIRNSYWSLIWISQKLTDFWEANKLAENLANFTYKVLLDKASVKIYKKVRVDDSSKDKVWWENYIIKNLIYNADNFENMEIDDKWQKRYLWLYEDDTWNYLIERTIPKSLMLQLSKLESWK